MKASMKWIALDLGIALVDIFAFSQAGLGLRFDGMHTLSRAAAYTVLAMSVAGIGYANYKWVFGAPAVPALKDKMPAAYYVEQLKKLARTLPFAAGEIHRGIDQEAEFGRKRVALTRVMALAGNKGLEVLASTDRETAACLSEYLRQMVARLTILDAKDEARYQESIRGQVYILLQKNEDLLNQFDVLLEEVSRMGDKVDVSSVGLMASIDALQKLRGAQAIDPGFETVAQQVAQAQRNADGAQDPVNNKESDGIIL